MAKKSGKGRPARPKKLPKHIKMDGTPKKGFKKNGAKTAAQLKHESIMRKKRRTSGAKNKKISAALKKYWASVSDAEKKRRAKKMWKKRKKMYPPKGFTKAGAKNLKHGGRRKTSKK